MRRGYLTLLGALFIASSDSPVLGRAQEPSKPTDASVLSFEGDTALWTVAIKPDKTADFEQTLSKLRSALAKSQDPQRRRQAAGWKVMRMTRPLPDGNVAFVHIIHPVVAGADYAIMPILYDAFPEERDAMALEARLRVLGEALRSDPAKVSRVGEWLLASGFRGGRPR